VQIPYVDEIGEDGRKHRTTEQRLRRFKGYDNWCKKVLCARQNGSTGKDQKKWRTS